MTGVTHPVPEGASERRVSLRKLSIWVTVLTALGMAVGLLLVVIVSDSVIRLAEQGGDVSARQRMEDLRAIGNLERLIALGDQLVEERETSRQRAIATTMQALSMQPAGEGRVVNPAVAETFDVVREIEATRGATRSRSTDAMADDVAQARIAELWSAHRNRLKAIADDTAVSLVQTITESSRAIVQGARLVLTVAVVGTLLAGLIGLVLVVTVRRQLLGPLMAISDYLVSLRKGVDAGLALPLARSREVADVVDAVSQLATAQHALERAALHDPLTGLSNRYGLEARMEQAMHHARRMGLKLAVMFIDLDRFKTVNDSLGHASGDKLLKVFADRFVACLREVDLVARPGGDEFVVVLNDELQATDVALVAEKLLDATSRPVSVDSVEVKLSASIGIAMFPDDGKDSSSLMKHADIAMYHAKSQGRANYQFFDQAMNFAITNRLQLEQALRQALDRNEFQLYFQPQMDGSGQRIVAAEALIRWEKPGEGLQLPASFIPVAEESGVIIAMGEWVLRSACEHLGTWVKMGLKIRLAVNLSVLQLSDSRVPEQLAQLLDRYALPADLLELEITETAAMSDPKATVESLRAFKRLGVSLAIDDFGTGYSSLTYLKLFPIDRLKLDRSFVADIERDPNADSICAATAGLAHSMGLQLVAEGVETHAQSTYLQQLGCDLMQGYYFHKPMPAAEFARVCLELQDAGQR